MYITVSGPSASGKGTISRAFARQFGLVHVDAGLIFRWIAYVSGQVGADVVSNSQILERYPMQYRWDGNRGSIEYAGEVLDLQLADPEIARVTSELASDPMYFGPMIEVTEKIISSFPTAIVDGRSAGTVLLPYAEAKFYIDAPLRVRAARRLSDLAEAHPELTYEMILSQLRERDYRDRTRILDPLRKPQGSLVIDSSSMSVSEIVAYMHRIVVVRGASL